MSNFDSPLPSSIKIFLEEIAELIVRLSGKSISESKDLMNQYWAGVQSMENEELFTETPYYWAMCILHHPTIGDNQPEWYLNPEHMPPPKWIVDKYYKHL